MKKFLKKSEGFTLVELIVVIAILGILTAIAVPTYSGYVKKADEAADAQTLSAVNTAIAAAMTENDVPRTKPKIDKYLDFSATANATDGYTITVSVKDDADAPLEGTDLALAQEIVDDFTTYNNSASFTFSYYEDVAFAADGSGNLVGVEP